MENIYTFEIDNDTIVFKISINKNKFPWIRNIVERFVDDATEYFRNEWGFDMGDFFIVVYGADDLFGRDTEEQFQ